MKINFHRLLLILIFMTTSVVYGADKDCKLKLTDVPQDCKYLNYSSVELDAVYKAYCSANNKSACDLCEKALKKEGACHLSKCIYEQIMKDSGKAKDKAFECSSDAFIKYLKADVDECKGTNGCSTNAKCSNIHSSYLCDCNSGFTGNGKTCNDTNECQNGTNNCHANATCTNNPGSFSCACKPGYQGNGTTTCDDVDECATGANNCSANATCTNNPGSFSCACKPGYQGNGQTCTDVDECALGTHNCSANASCTNNPGSFSCACKPGYQGNGQTCTDIDECSNGTHNCSTNANCSNNPGSFSCACKPGYQGNGQTCTDIDECSNGTHNCSTNANCSNNPGSFSCACKPGYQGNGQTCTDINECATGAHNCNVNANCTNNNGSFSCACKPGYQGNGNSCSLIQVCMNGILEPGEQCDDANSNNNDSCSNACNVQALYHIGPARLCENGDRNKCIKDLPGCGWILGTYNEGLAFTLTNQNLGQMTSIQGTNQGSGHLMRSGWCFINVDCQGNNIGAWDTKDCAQVPISGSSSSDYCVVINGRCFKKTYQDSTWQ